MVPNVEEPFFYEIIDFISKKCNTFAASNFDTTTELTLQMVGGVLKTTYDETDDNQQQEHYGQESKSEARY